MVIHNEFFIIYLRAFLRLPLRVALRALLVRNVKRPDALRGGLDKKRPLLFRRVREDLRVEGILYLGFRDF